MKFSENWLREWVNPNIDSITLQNQIIDSGIEIESVNFFNPTFKGVIVGKIISCFNHPKSKKLKIIKLDIGHEKVLNIVCGAPNCRNNIKVVVATIGSVLRNQFKIDLKIIQGVKSEGMLCSFFELGLSNNYSNDIIELPKKAPVGAQIKDYFLLQDNIIKISATPNRADSLSILGIARNIAVINNLEKIKLKLNILSEEIADKFPININVRKKNINFFGRIIKNTNLNVSTPFWMKKKLFFCDLLSENIIDNIINYVLIEIGQPLNIIDANKINRFIQIGMSNEKEFLHSSAYPKIILNKKILSFSDNKKILFIPGNINSQSVEINEKTTSIFLCSYYIDREFTLNILKKINNNKILDYHNYGIDPNLQKYALQYATNLIIKICGGQVGPISKKVQKQDTNLILVKKIKLNLNKFKKLVGHTIQFSLILNILSRLEYIVSDVQKEYFEVIPPGWRSDILIEEDIISDILRIYNYNNILFSPIKEKLIFTQKKDFQEDLLDKATAFLAFRGYNEIITYSFINPDLQSIMFPNIHSLLLSNPISKDLSSMRLSLWPGLLKSVVYNSNRRQDSICLFERGFCFSIDKNKILGVNQELFLAGIISGFKEKENWFSKRRKLDFYDLKGDVESVLELVHNKKNIEFKNSKIPSLHPEQSAKIYINNLFIGSMGKINPRLEKQLNLDSSTFLFELSLNNIPITPFFKIKKVSKFPESRRDIAILVKKDILFSEIIKICKKFFLNQAVDINLFDVYFPHDTANEQKSLGISFIFQDQNKTLEENEINLMIDGCVKALKDEFNITLRM